MGWRRSNEQNNTMLQLTTKTVLPRVAVNLPSRAAQRDDAATGLQVSAANVEMRFVVSGVVVPCAPRGLELTGIETKNACNQTNG